MLQRSIVLSVVVILHIGLFKLPWTSRTTLAVPAGFESIVVLLPDTIPPAEALHIPDGAENTKSNVPTKTNPVELDKPEELPDPATTVSANEQTAPTPRELRAATATAIQQAARAITARPTTRRFGESIQRPQPATKPPTAFTEPAHRFGDITETQDGDSLVWLSENCYQIANSDNSHFMSFALGVPDTSKQHVRCQRSLGKPQPNSHLFDHLKRPEATE